tara:strand:+ start:535 stop:873 length:339 start_codon:yes stop_codon:yes gene_type:complete
MSNERIETYEEDITELRDTHFDTRLEERLATATMFNRLLNELKRCYELIDVMQGNVPYVEDCEVCGASDGHQTEGCDDCGITHYQTSRGLRALHGYTWGFFHKDSPLWEKYQ